MTYMRMFNLNLDQMADEMYDCYSRLLTFDFPRVKDTHKKYVSETTCCENNALVSADDDWRAV